MGLPGNAEQRLAVVSSLGATLLLAGIGAVTSSTVALSMAVAGCMMIAALSPLGALGAVVATLPWFYQPIAIGQQEFAISELLLVSAAAGTSLRIGWELLTRRRSISDAVAALLAAGSTRIALILGALSAVGLWLALHPFDPLHRDDSLREWRWVLAEPLAFVVLLGVVATSGSARRLLALMLIGGVSVAAAQGFLDILGNGGLAVEGVTRISGPFPHPNALGLMTTRAIALAIAWMALDGAVRRALAVPTAIGVMAVLATFSRGAWASLTVAVLLSASHLGTWSRRIVLAGPVAVVFVAMVLASDRMRSLFGGGSGSLRLSLWRSATEMIRDRPLLGYGPDQFLYAYLPRYVEPVAWNERFSSHAHNLILDFWIRLGIIGCAFVIGAAVVCLVALVGVVRRPRTDDALASAAVIALAAILAHGLIDDAYFSHELAMSGWLLAWLAVQPGCDGAVEGARNGARPRLWRRGFHWVTPLRQPARRRP
ncbi:MAG TPA: O-antigen ligase family protein [Thermomicrobiales bacterium]|nr:O-antigen ligase family protein [Thermomicrobiales bacterium]